MGPWRQLAACLGSLWGGRPPHPGDRVTAFLLTAPVPSRCQARAVGENVMKNLLNYFPSHLVLVIRWSRVLLPTTFAHPSHDLRPHSICQGPVDMRKTQGHRLFLCLLLSSLKGIF